MIEIAIAAADGSVHPLLYDDSVGKGKPERPHGVDGKAGVLTVQPENIPPMRGSMTPPRRSGTPTSTSSEVFPFAEPSVYGFDHACLLDALRRSDGRCRGIAAPAPEAELTTLEAMHEAGVRGIRCNLINSGGLAFESMRRWWPWMIEHRWHLELQIGATRTDFCPLIEPGMPAIVVTTRLAANHLQPFGH